MSRNLVPGLLLLTTSLMFMSCATKRPVMKAVRSTVSVEQEGLAATLSYRDDESLVRQFGKETNPFLTEYGKIQFRRRMVFELTIENQNPEAYRFRLADCELQYGSKTAGSTSQFQFINEILFMEDSPKLAKQKEPIIKKYLLPNERTVPPGGSLRGLLLFQGNLPAQGAATIFVPGIPKGSSLQFDFEF